MHACVVYACIMIYYRSLNVGPLFFNSLCMHRSPSVQDPKAFATSLLDFIGSNAQYLYSKMVMTSSDVDTSKDGQHADRLKQVQCIHYIE